MKSLIPLIFFFICSNLYAYQPKLMLLGSFENKGESFIDVNAHQKIRDSFKQAVIYEKYANPIKDEQGVTYQSVIKQLIVDCTGKTIAIRGADYFAGKTSNSKLVKKFDDITLSHDGDTGAAFYSFDDLEFKALNQDKFYNKIYANTCK